jgi:hypothetical protein
MKKSLFNFIFMMLIISCEGVLQFPAVIISENYFLSKNQTSFNESLNWGESSRICLKANHLININPYNEFYESTKDEVLTVVKFLNENQLIDKIEISNNTIDLSPLPIQDLEYTLIPYSTTKIIIDKFKPNSDPEETITVELNNCKNDESEKFNPWTKIHLGSGKSNFRNIKPKDTIAKFYQSNSRKIIVEKTVNEVKNEQINFTINLVILSIIPLNIELNIWVDMNKEMTIFNEEEQREYDQETKDFINQVVQKYIFEEIPYKENFSSYLNDPIKENASISFMDFLYETKAYVYKYNYQYQSRNIEMIYAINSDSTIFPLAPLMVFSLRDKEISKSQSLADNAENSQIIIDYLSYRQRIDKAPERKIQITDIKNNSSSIQKIKQYIQSINNGFLNENQEKTYPFYKNYEVPKYTEAVILFYREMK